MDRCPGPEDETMAMPHNTFNGNLQVDIVNVLTSIDFLGLLQIAPLKGVPSA